MTLLIIVLAGCALASEPAASQAVVRFDEARNGLVLYPGEARQVDFHVPADPSRAHQRWPIIALDASCACLAVSLKDNLVFDDLGAADFSVIYHAALMTGKTSGVCVVRVAETSERMSEFRVRISAEIQDYIAWPSGSSVIDLNHANETADGWVVVIGRGGNPDKWHHLKIVADQSNPPFIIFKRLRF